MKLFNFSLTFIILFIYCSNVGESKRKKNEGVTEFTLPSVSLGSAAALITEAPAYYEDDEEEEKKSIDNAKDMDTVDSKNDEGMNKDDDKKESDEDLKKDEVVDDKKDETENDPKEDEKTTDKSDVDKDAEDDDKEAEGDDKEKGDKDKSKIDEEKTDKKEDDKTESDEDTNEEDSSETDKDEESAKTDGESDEDDYNEEDGDVPPGDDESIGGIQAIIEKIIKGPSKKELPKNARSEDVYIHLSKMFSGEMEKTLTKLLPKIYDYAFTIELSGDCYTAMVQVANGVRNGKSWAVKMVDSSGKLPVSLLDGTFTDLGNFDQCLRVTAFGDPEGQAPPAQLFKGKYCLTKIHPAIPPKKPFLKFTDKIYNYTNTPLEGSLIEYISTISHSLYSHPITLGVCIPSNCEPKDLDNVFNSILGKYHMKVEVGPECDSNDDKPKLTVYQLIAIVIFYGLVALVSFATICELIKNKDADVSEKSDKNSIVSVLLCFSAKSNLEKLLSTKSKRHDENELPAIRGFKVLVMIWIVIANVYLLGHQTQIKNLIRSVHAEMEIHSNSLLFQVILNFWYAIEIFFMISGILVAFHTTKLLDLTNGKLDLAKFTVLRWLRLTPSLMGAILLTFLLPLGNHSGPVFHNNTMRVAGDCEMFWWKSLLYITNWYKPDDFCLVHTWYLSADFQLYVLSFVIIMAIFNSKSFGIFLNFALIAAGVAIPSFIAKNRNISAVSPIINRPLLEEIPTDIKYQQFMTFNHFSSYFIGIAIGVALAKNRPPKFNFILRALCWMVLPLISLISILITFKWNNWVSAASLDPKVSVLFAGFHRLAFILGPAWILYECLNDRGGLINKFLSHKLLMPLNRLTYQIFLMNILVIWLYYFSKRDLIVYRDTELLMTAAGIYLVTVMLSIVTYLIFEVPFRNLLNLRSSKFEEEPTNNNNEIKEIEEQILKKQQMQNVELHLTSLNDFKGKSLVTYNSAVIDNDNNNQNCINTIITEKGITNPSFTDGEQCDSHVDCVVVKL